jgi:hypothetical protein
MKYQKEKRVLKILYTCESQVENWVILQDKERDILGSSTITVKIISP